MWKFLKTIFVEPVLIIGALILVVVGFILLISPMLLVTFLFFSTQNMYTMILFLPAIGLTFYFIDLIEND